MGLDFSITGVSKIGFEEVRYKGEKLLEFLLFVCFGYR